MNFTTLGTSYNWNHTILASFCDRLILLGGFPGSSAVKNPPANAGDMGSIPGEEKWQPSPVFLPGKSCGQRGLTGYCPWDRKRVEYDLVTKQQQISMLLIIQSISL